MRPLLPLLAIVVMLGHARAQEPRRVDVDVSEAALATVLVDVARQADASVVVDPRIEAVVTVRLQGVSFREAVDELARRTGCVVEERAASVLVVSRQARLSASFADADVRDALTQLARPDGEAWWVDPRVTTRVSVDVRDATWADAVHAVAGAAGAKVTMIDGCALVGVDVPNVAARESLATLFPGSERITTAVTGGDLRPLLGAIVAATNRPASSGRAPPGVVGTFHDVPWAEALDAVVQAIGWEARVDASRGLRVGPRRLCTKEGEAPVPTRVALLMVGRPTGTSFVVGPGVTGAQRQRFAALPCELALRLVAHAAELHVSSSASTLVIDDVAHPEEAPSESDGPTFELQAEGASARGWFELLATVGALDLEVTPEVQGEVTAILHGVTARRALELTARVNGHTLVERDDALQLGGAGREAPPHEPAPVEDAPAPAPPPPVDPALAAEVAGLVDELLTRAEQGPPATTAEPLAAIEKLLARPRGPEAARAAMAAHEQRLATNDEARLSLLLKVHDAEAAALLRDMNDALAQERRADVRSLVTRFERLLAQMETLRVAVFTTKAQRLRLRAADVVDRCERLERLGGLDLRVMATALGRPPALSAALINGAVLQASDRIPAPDGAPLGADLGAVENGFVYVRFEGFSIARRVSR